MAQADPDPRNEALVERIRRLEEQLEAMRQREARRPQAIIERLVPPEVRGHLRAAQRERLLAVRAWIDAAIKRTDEPPEHPRRPESLRIE